MILIYKQKTLNLLANRIMVTALVVCCAPVQDFNTKIIKIAILAGDTIIIHKWVEEKLWYLLKNVGIWTANTQYLVLALKLWLEVNIWVLSWTCILYLQEVATRLTDPKKVHIHTFYHINKKVVLPKKYIICTLILKYGFCYLHRR